MKHKLITESWRKFIKEDCWDGYERVEGSIEGAPGSCKKKTNESEEEKLGEQQEAPEGCDANVGCDCVDSSVNIPITKIQQFLANKYGKELMQKTFESGVADGECGAETRMMIMKYQSENKLRCDACVGVETGASMFPDMDLQAAAAAPVAGKAAAPVSKSIASRKFTPGQDPGYPIVNGKNFILPIEGKSRAGHAGFSQPRGRTIHGAVDVFAPLGTPIVAIADGKIWANTSQQKYEGDVKRLADLCNKRNKQGKLLDDINAAMGGVVDIMKEKGRDKAAAYRQSFINKLNNKYQQGKIPDAPYDWKELKRWGDRILVPKAMPALLRWYRKNMGLKFPLGGIGLTLMVDPDQYGNKFSIYHGHLDEAIVQGGRVKAGDVIGTVGNTAIFDKGGEHLHYSVSVVSDKGQKIPNSGGIKGFNHAPRRLDPVRVVPGYGATGIYAGLQS